VKRIIPISTAGCLFIFVLIAAMSASSVLAAVQYTFDPGLSLTGDCVKDEVDGVEDPSCPYPPPPAGPSPEGFRHPAGIALDSYGDAYVVVDGLEQEGKGRVDIFDPQGLFLTEVPVADPGEPEHRDRPLTAAVDSDGYLYVYSGGIVPKLWRYDPDLAHYDPASGEIAYEPAPTVVFEGGSSSYAALAVNPEDDHLFVNFGVATDASGAVEEFGSATEGNPLEDENVADVCCFSGPGLAIDASRNRLYVTDQETVVKPRIIDVFELSAPHNLIEEIDGSSTPEGNFVTAGALALAVDESTGNLFAYDVERQRVIYELTEDGQYLASIQHSLLGFFTDKQVAVDNGAHSPNPHYLWATAEPNGHGHAFAFEPREQCPPDVRSISATHIGEVGALLRAEVEPCNLETSYRFEYVTAQQFVETQFLGANVAGEGTIPRGGVPVEVFAGASGLSPSTRYAFRVTATNELGGDEAEGGFRTFPFSSPPTGSCSNEGLRTGPSALLPDCRAYELVTPANTNGLAPLGSGGLGPLFLSRTVSPDGYGASFGVEGGLIPGSEGTGSLGGDPYLATRGPNGWNTQGTGGRGSEFLSVVRGGRSADQNYSVWTGVVNSANSNYVRFPDGHSELLGQGSLGDDPAAKPDLISPGGTHIVFTSGVRLEERAPPGRDAIYDRVGGATYVVSLLPGNSTPSEPATYVGASQDGRGIAFRLGTGSSTKLYLRYNDEETFEIGEGLTFEGVAEGGRRIFYLQEGKLYAFDIDKGTIAFATGTDTRVVNVARDGSTAYYVSKSKLTSVPNPLGEKAKAGRVNLYLSREGAVSFVGILTESDVEGEGSNFKANGLGQWSKNVTTIGALPQDPSRTSIDGSVLLFQSRAPLTGYDNAGKIEVYRYDSAAPGSLRCVSCNPTEAPATADATLQSLAQSPTIFPTWTSDRIENLTANGDRAFFESTEALVASDVDGLRDVYEWEAPGLGTCAQPQGCVFLVSSGHSSHEDFLFGVSENGDDVFVESNDLLVPERDPDETRSIYDARVGGGFPVVSQPGECLGEACQPILSPPERPTQVLQGHGNVSKPRPHCRKGRHAVRRHGRYRCVKRRHRAHHRGRGAAANGRKHR
jgi:hypothetical protein